jgi:polyphosphate kinase
LAAASWSLSSVLHFRNSGAEESTQVARTWLRNLKRRVEALFPVESPRPLVRLRDEVLKTYIADETSARRMRSDGSYTPKSRESQVREPELVLSQRVSQG